MQKTATTDDLSTVHKLLTDWCIRLLNGQLTRPVTDSEGNVTEVVVHPTASDLAVIRAFLKDNNITASPGSGNPLAELERALSAQSRAALQFDPEVGLQ
jgi:hypothetical protein